MDQLKKALIVLIGAFLSFILAYNPFSRAYLPEPEFTQIPVVLSPLILSLLAAFKPFKNYQIFVYIVALPILGLFLGFYVFALVLRNLR